MRPSAHSGRFVLAIFVAVVVVLSAPFVGHIRSWIRATFPGQFVAIVTLLAAVTLLGVLVAAALRIRERRVARDGAILAGIVLAAAYSQYAAGDNPESNAVERFHFIEYGLVTFLFYRAWRPLEDLGVLLLPMLAGLIVGAAEEWLQWFIPNRVGEFRDIFLNGAAIASGLLFSLGVDPPARVRLTLGRDSARRGCWAAAAAVIALAAFVHAVHLGYDVEDAEIGTFTSRYGARALPELQAAKEGEWKRDPPPMTLRRLSREDQYLSEGLAHVRWRNRQWDAGNIRAAWSENRILENYFAPVLDTPTYEGRGGHRWPAPQRADAETRMSRAPIADRYVSQAYPYRILTWSRVTFWAFAGGLAAALVLLSRRPGALPVQERTADEDRR
ncbi:MAG TPA: VanZ family protein [Vicinamibacterales bacterium]|nr:VanZ family protein [Vicinamibacterales bacterium]